MNARPRKKKYRHFPDYLNYDKAKDLYILTLTNGKRKSLGRDRTTAIAIAREYNLTLRPENIISIDNLLIESMHKETDSKLFSDYADQLLLRAITEESPASDTLSVWNNDIVRIKEYFNIQPNRIDLSHVNEYLKKYHSESSSNVQNRKVSFLKKLFSYAMDESIMKNNPASLKKMKRTERKVRKRLSLDDYNRIWRLADLWMKTAMDLALQTAHARLEISRIKYNIGEPRDGVCGCIWEKDKTGLYGYLYIHRQKVQHKEASHVAIPIGEELKRIIDSSRDGIVSPYVVHRLREGKSNPISKEVTHPTQISPDYISRTFSKLRDKAGVMASIPQEERPTFHEIRALSAWIFKQQGVDPQARMAHSDAKSTKIYTENHVEWLAVPHAEIKNRAV